VESAITAAITAPTKPKPTTTTTSLPALRCAVASFVKRLNSARYSAGLGNGNRSPVGLMETRSFGMVGLVVNGYLIGCIS
jgi:hypothetical protein